MTERSPISGRNTLERVHIRAPAKVNLILKVLDRRPDGYHNLWSLMQTVALEDELSLQRHPRSREIRLTSNDPMLPTDDRNLIVRAATLVLQRAGERGGVDIEVNKHIPTGAGLGGGSSDAAATIRGLNHLLGLDWPVGDMVTLGLALGSDVPFFFFAPTAVVRGRGEEVFPVPLVGDRWILLVRPDFPVSTKWAYEQLAATRRSAGIAGEAPHVVSTDDSLTWDEVIGRMENDFESLLSTTYPVFGKIKQSLMAHGAEVALLSGSGSTMFGVFRTQADASLAQKSLNQAPGHWSALVRTCSSPPACT